MVVARDVLQLLLRSGVGLLEVTPHNRNAQGVFNMMRDNKRLWKVSYEVYGQDWRSNNFLVQL